MGKKWRKWDGVELELVFWTILTIVGVTALWYIVLPGIMKIVETWK